MNKIKINAFLLALIICLTFCIQPNYANEIIPPVDTGTVQTQTPSYASAPMISAYTYVLMDADSGQILLGTNENERVYPASTTKIITVLLALELSGGDLSPSVTIPNSAIDAISHDTSTHIAIDYGEILTLEDLVYAAMLPSANDACNAIAAHFYGEEWATEYPKKMNEKAKEIGAVNSNFSNTNGLYDANHYTTAYDMALITAYALKNQQFKEIYGEITHNIPATNKKGERNYIVTTNELLKNGEFKYDYAIGGKTGYVPEAGYTFVSAAKKGTRTLIASLMKNPSSADRFSNSIKLFDYGFDFFTEASLPSETLPRERLNVIENGFITAYASIFASENISFLIHKALSIEDININSDIPEVFETATPNANVILSLSSPSNYMNSEIGVFPLTVISSPLSKPVIAPGYEQTPTTPNESNSSDNEVNTAPGKTDTPKINIVQIIAIALLSLLLIAVVVLICVYVYSNLARKKKAKQKRLERLKSRSINPSDKKEAEKQNADDVYPSPDREIKKQKPQRQKIPTDSAARARKEEAFRQEELRKKSEEHSQYPNEGRRFSSQKQNVNEIAATQRISRSEITQKSRAIPQSIDSIAPKNEDNETKSFELAAKTEVERKRQLRAEIERKAALAVKNESKKHD